jgi:spoIIIJ-associated protein
MKYQGKPMSLKKKDFYGKEVTDAIKKACDELGVAQEKLDIEVVETGSTGIFGLIRKKAHIRAMVKTVAAKITAMVPAEEEEIVAPPPPPKKSPVQVQAPSEPEENVYEGASEDVPLEVGGEKDDDPEEIAGDDLPLSTEDVQISQENLDIVQAELSRLLELMGYPSTVQIESSGISVHCFIQGGFEEALTGQDGKTLDSLQYILRKIIARKLPDRLRLSLDIGDFRERRQVELAEKALELAKMVKEDGKTQVLAALNPSERRVVHMTLQEDKDIRSRSVGEGLFKKILIYKPGKGKKPGPRKHHSPRGKGKNSKPDTEK